MATIARPSSYEQAVSEHRWRVPERYNIAADVCDSPAAQQGGDGLRGLQGRPARARLGRARLAREPGRKRARQARRAARRPGGGLLPPLRRRPRRCSSAPTSSARSCSRSRCSTATRGSRHRLRDSEPKLLVTDADNARAHRGVDWSTSLIVFDEKLSPVLDDLRDRRHLRRRSGPALLHVGHHRARQGHPARAPLPARARRVRRLPRRQRGRALPRHGGVGLGGRDLSVARALAPTGRCSRLPARGRLRPRRALEFDLHATRPPTSSRPRPRSAR